MPRAGTLRVRLSTALARALTRGHRRLCLSVCRFVESAFLHVLGREPDGETERRRVERENEVSK